jgi:hypothetical protein
MTNPKSPERGFFIHHKNSLKMKLKKTISISLYQAIRLFKSGHKILVPIIPELGANPDNIIELSPEKDSLQDLTDYKNHFINVTKKPISWN